MADAPLAAVADDLYGRDPGEFTAARNAAAKQAKADGDPDLAAAVKALPKPTTAAWLVNQVARRMAGEVEDLLAVGDALREATADADAAALKDLGAKRRAVLAATTRQAQALARELGNPVSEAIVREVSETLHAGLVDAAAAQAVRSGRLVAALSPAGFGSVDLTGALAAADHAARPAPARTRPGKDREGGAKRAAALEAAWAAAADARAALEAAGGDAAEAETGLGLATAHREQVQNHVEAATEALRVAREALTGAERAERDATERQRAAAKALDAAQRASDRAAATLRDLQ